MLTGGRPHRKSGGLVVAFWLPVAAIVRPSGAVCGLGAGGTVDPAVAVTAWRGPG